jgi:broad specificity phosphatase PhoE
MIPLEVVASSHLSRAFETANTVHSKHPAAKRTVCEGLGEMRFGDFEGRCIHGPEATDETKQTFRDQKEQMQQDPKLS